MKLTKQQSKMKSAPEDRSIKCSYKTASAEVLIGNMGKKRVMSIMFINNTEEGNGCVGILINKLDGYARQCRCNEIWFPTVLSEILLKILIQKGFKLQIHNDELFGRVEVFVKRFKRNIRIKKFIKVKPTLRFPHNRRLDLEIWVTFDHLKRKSLRPSEIVKYLKSEFPEREYDKFDIKWHMKTLPKIYAVDATISQNTYAEQYYFQINNERSAHIQELDLKELFTWLEKVDHRNIY